MRQRTRFTTALLLCLALVGFAACGDKAADDKDNGASKEAGTNKSFDKPGFKTFVKEGRLWIFQEGSEGLAEFQKSGEPAKSVTVVGAGPDGMTVRSDDRGVIDAYMKAQ